MTLLERKGSARTEKDTGADQVRGSEGPAESGQRTEDRKEQGSAGGDRRRGWKWYLGYFAVYTAVFCVVAAAVFVWFWLQKKRFVWQTDGVNQHYYGLVYFSRWGKEVLRQLRETHVLRLPTFTFRMGYGEDLYTTLAYYVIGDPFSLPAVLIPEKYLLTFHDLMLLVRFWLAGITFSVYCFYMNRKSRPAVLTGALIYIFNGFTMAAMRHHYFLNPFVFFPVLLIGCEQVLHRKKPWLYIFMVFLTAVSNFYFFYMIVVMTALYAVWRSVRMRGLRRIGQVLIDGLLFLWYGLLGTLLSAFLFLPVVLRFLQDPRTTGDRQIRLLWPLSFYRQFPESFLNNGDTALSESWTYMGFGVVAALCILYIFLQRKRHLDQKAAFLGLTAILLTPAGGYILNGFSYTANRWMWAYALLIGFMSVTAIQEMADVRLWQLAVMFCAALAGGLCCLYDIGTFSRSTMQAVITAMVILVILLTGRLLMAERKGTADRERIGLRIQAGFLLCTMFTAVFGGYINFAPEQNSKVFEYLSRAQIETQTAKDAAAAAELIDSRLLQQEEEQGADAGEDGTQKGQEASSGAVPFYRYTTYNPENNTSLLYGVSNTQYYWSLSNAATAQFLNETGQLNDMIHLYDTLDDRTALNEIAGIRYFLGNDTEGVPYGYEKIDGLSYSNDELWPDNESLERVTYEVYENKYALPLGFTSSGWISREEYEALDIPQRQQALMQGILLEADPGEGFTRVSAGELSGESGAGLAFSDVRVPMGITFGKKGEDSDGTLKVTGGQNGQKYTVDLTENGGKMILRFSGLPACETSLYIRGLSYAPHEGKKRSSQFFMPVTGYRGETEVCSKMIRFRTAQDAWTTGREDYLVNLRFREEPLDRIELDFPEPGIWTFDSVEVVCQPMTEYPAQAQELGRETLTDLDIHEMGRSSATEKVTGNITVDGPRILCLQIPRTAGWTAYVDGVRAELLQADTMFSALLLPAGTHAIELRYQTPGLRLGAVISAGTFLLLVLFRIIYAIVSAVLLAAERRTGAIPVGEFEHLAEPGTESSENLERSGEQEGAENPEIAERAADPENLEKPAKARIMEHKDEEDAAQKENESDAAQLEEES